MPWWSRTARDVDSRSPSRSRELVGSASGSARVVGRAPPQRGEMAGGGGGVHAVPPSRRGRAPVRLTTGGRSGTLPNNCLFWEEVPGRHERRRPHCRPAFRPGRPRRQPAAARPRRGGAVLRREGLRRHVDARHRRGGRHAARLALLPLRVQGRPARRGLCRGRAAHQGGGRGRAREGRRPLAAPRERLRGAPRRPARGQRLRPGRDPRAARRRARGREAPDRAARRVRGDVRPGARRVAAAAAHRPARAAAHAARRAQLVADLVPVRQGFARRCSRAGSSACCASRWTA